MRLRYALPLHRAQPWRLQSTRSSRSQLWPCRGRGKPAQPETPARHRGLFPKQDVCGKTCRENLNSLFAIYNSLRLSARSCRGLRCGVLRRMPYVRSSMRRVSGSMHLRHDQGGNCMFENQLLLAVGIQNNGILIERPDSARELNATQEVDCNWGFFFAC